jgi:hypothetical protein
MKANLKIFSVVIGVIVALGAFSNTDLYANPTEKNSIHKFEIRQSEMIKILENVLEKEPVVLKTPKKCMKFYNDKKQLVYECRDKDDAHAKILLRRSDLMLNTNTSSYYLLD